MYYYCDDVYHRGNICKKRQLFIITGTEEEGKEEDLIQSKQLEIPSTSMEEDNSEVTITFNALAGEVNQEALRIKGLVKKSPVIILIDSCSSTIF